VTARLQLHLSGDLDHLRVVWQTGEALLESTPFEGDAEAARYDVLVAVQEIVTNVIRHAYLGATTEPVGIEFEVDEHQFAVTVADRGPEFDPSRAQTRGMTTEEPPRECGGWGVMIVKTTMDEVVYERRDGWNRLRVVKYVVARSTEGSRSGVLARGDDR
jgi:anti-sigma regulatory factor (Ser/Thr protein kinase)